MDAWNCYTGPDGIEYSLEHLAPSEILINLQIKTEILTVPLWVVYRDHCYSRDFNERNEGDNQSWLLPENPRDKNRRLFCKDRWMYSHGLPSLVRGIVESSAVCHRTTERGLYYRLERSSRRGAGPDEGVYLFLKLSPNSRNPMGVKLSVESVHERTNRPSNDRGRQSLKFWGALKEFLEKRPEILEAIRKQKAPDDRGL
jgi:hypothetical protein